MNIYLLCVRTPKKSVAIEQIRNEKYQVVYQIEQHTKVLVPLV